MTSSNTTATALASDLQNVMPHEAMYSMQACHERQAVSKADKHVCRATLRLKTTEHSNESTLMVFNGAQQTVLPIGLPVSTCGGTLVTCSIHKAA